MADKDKDAFCINCKNLVQSTEKVWKVNRIPFRNFSKTNKNEGEEIGNKVSVGFAISVIVKETETPALSNSDKQFVCKKCGDLLELAYNAVQDFRELTRNESLLIEKRSSPRKVVPNLESPVKRSQSLELRRSPIKRKKVHNKTLTEDEIKKESLNIAASIDLSVYHCSLCNFEFDHISSFQNHLSKHEDDTVEEKEAGKTQKRLGSQSDDDLIEKLKCKLCNEGSYNSVDDLKSHYGNEHPMISLLTVDDVQNEGKNPKDEKGFINGRFIFNCNVCSKRFTRHDHVKLHLRVHTKEKPFQCRIDGCNKTFSDPRGLAYHEVTHSSDRPYCCKFCGMTFKRLHHLNDHERNHTDVPRRFVCQHCDKGFKQQKHLNSHMITHKGTKEHQCTLCNKSFNRKDNLQQHVKKVHGKEPSPKTSKKGHKGNPDVEPFSLVQALPVVSIANSTAPVSSSLSPSIVIPPGKRSKPLTAAQMPVTLHIGDSVNNQIKFYMNL